MKKLSYCFLIVLAIMYNGCVSRKCKPVLFPYVEYDYHAAPRKLVGLYTPTKDSEIIDFYHLKIEKPQGWLHEIPFEKTLHLFPPGKARSVIISYNLSRTIKPNDYKGMNLIGCDNFEVSDHEEIKTSKDLITDLYLFTEEQFNNLKIKPTFWHYSILWTKTTALHNMLKMFHYQGHNIEAFRLDFNRERSDTNIYSTITIFHQKTEPDYFTISTTFEDDDFIDFFVDMIDMLN
jgi:hypothetical protein